MVYQRVRPSLLCLSSTYSPPCTGVMFVYSARSLESHTHMPLSDQTGRSDIPLTQRGEEQIKSKAPFLVGEGSTTDRNVGCVVIHLIVPS